MSSAKSHPGVVVPHRIKWHQRLTASLIHGLAQALSATWRIRFHDESGCFNGARGPVLFCTWHNRLALSMSIYHGYVRPRRPGGLAAMISASRDGGLLAQVLKKYEVVAARGSTSRRGRQALLESVSWIEKGYHVAITPDGPRGPCYEPKEGVIGLAQLTGIPIIPVTSRIRGKLQTRSWDRFQIPLPFARCDVYIRPPIQVPRDADEAQRAALLQQLKSSLLSKTVD